MTEKPPPDDRHPIVREWLAWTSASLRGVRDPEIPRFGDEHFEAALRREDLDPAQLADPLAELIQANVNAAFASMKQNGVTPGQAIGDAVLSSILFGIRLARRGLV